MARCKGTLFLLLALLAQTKADFQASDYISYTPGNCNIIFSMPHGGKTKPSDVPERQLGCKLGGSTDCTYGTACDGEDRTSSCPARIIGDSYTVEVGLAAARTVAEELPGCQPHVIYTSMHRSRIDVNREPEEGAQGNANALATYDLYHSTILDARDAFNGGRGILFDIHGQAHKQNSTEIGYLLAYYQLKKVHAGKDYNSQRETIGVQRLLEEQSPRQTMNQFLLGSGSLGSLIEAEEGNFRAIPSSTLPEDPPVSDYKYFKGGFIARTYGSGRDSLDVLDSVSDALQLEVQSEVRVKCDGDVSGQYSDDSPADCIREKFGVALGKAIAKFYTEMY